MKYSLDISEKEYPFANIEVANDKVLIGSYEDGKIARKLFYMNKKQLEVFVKGLHSVITLMDKN